MLYMFFFYGLINIEFASLASLASPDPLTLLDPLNPLTPLDSYPIYSPRPFWERGWG